MAGKELILDRYEVLGTAGAGGFGVVRIAWDPRIQRKVAIKTIALTERDALRAALPGAEAVAKGSPQGNKQIGSAHGAKALTPAQARTSRLEAGEDEYDYPFAFKNEGPSGPKASISQQAPAERGNWRGVTPWREFLEEEDIRAGATRPEAPLPTIPAILQVPEVHAEDPSEKDDFTAGDTLAMEDAAFTPPVTISALPDDGSSEPVTALAHIPGLDEARTAAKLSDSRIVTVYDFEVRERTAYLIMEYIEGITLTRLLDDYDDFLTLDMVTSVFDSVAGALTVAHKAGVLHLDIKPDNIIINREGEAKVTDFGLATLADASGAGTTGGGTIGYMPLEQMRREHLDARTDEWALAAMTYEMLAGDNPFSAPTLQEAERAILDAELVLPSLCWNGLDDQVDDVIFYALDPDREERYANVRDFAEEMDKFLGDADKGKGELALVVSEALFEPEEAPIEGFPAAWERQERKGGFLSWLPLAVSQIGNADEAHAHETSYASDGKARPRTRVMAPAATPFRRDAHRPRLQERLSAYLEDYEGESAEDAQEEWIANEEPAPARIPFAHRIPSRMLSLAGYLFGFAATGFVAALAVSNLPPIRSLPNEVSLAIVLAVAAAMGVFSLFKPTMAALVSFCALAVALLACGHPIVAAALAVACLLWWYVTGRPSQADANVVLLEPLAGAIGLSPLVPFAAGLALHPIQAGVSVACAAVIACVLGSFGSASLLGWDAPACWAFADADITRTFARMITRPLTWTMLASWLVAAVALSLFNLNERRGMLLAGLAVAAVAMLVGTLAFTAPTPQFLLTLIAIAGGICVLFL